MVVEVQGGGPPLSLFLFLSSFLRPSLRPPSLLYLFLMCKNRLVAAV